MLVSVGFELATSHTIVFPIRNKLSKPVSGNSACFEGFQQCEPMKSRIYLQQSIGILSDAFKSKKKKIRENLKVITYLAPQQTLLRDSEVRMRCVSQSHQIQFVHPPTGPHQETRSVLIGKQLQLSLNQGTAHSQLVVAKHLASRTTVLPKNRNIFK